MGQIKDTFVSFLEKINWAIKTYLKDLIIALMDNPVYIGLCYAGLGYPWAAPVAHVAHVAPTVTEVKILQVKYVPTVKNVELMNTKKCLKRQVFFHDIDIRLHVVLPLYTAAPSQIETISPGLVWA